MNTKFIYDEKTSSFFAPDGTFLKKIFCPKAIRWNQLLVEDKEDRWRKCSSCKENVLNLDALDSKYVLENFGTELSDICLYASSNSNIVIFLKDPNEIPMPTSSVNDEAELVIHTARSIKDIERAIGMGYWADVRLVIYDTENIKSKITIGQNCETGQIKYSSDYRRSFKHSSIFFSDEDVEKVKELNTWEEVIPFTNFYPNYQSAPIAAYLIPYDVPDNTKVIVKDPIEDIVGGSWNQGNSWRAYEVPGYIKNRKVYLEPEKVEVSRLIG